MVLVKLCPLSMFVIPGLWYTSTSPNMFSVLDVGCYFVVCVILLLHFEGRVPLKTSFVFQMPALLHPSSWSMPTAPWPGSSWSIPPFLWQSSPTVLLLLLTFWLFLLGYLIGWKLRSNGYNHNKKHTGLRTKGKGRRFRRRNLPLSLVLCCRNRPLNPLRNRPCNVPPMLTKNGGRIVTTYCYTPKDWHNCRWRRRKTQAVKHQSSNLEKFLRLQTSGTKL